MLPQDAFTAATLACVDNPTICSKARYLPEHSVRCSLELVCTVERRGSSR